MKKGLFKVNTSSASYAPPVIKAVIAVAVTAALLILRFDLFRFQNQLLDTLIGIAVAAIVVLSVLRIYVSLAEIIAVHDNTSRKSSKQCRELSISDIVSLIEKNDIVELSVLFPGNNRSCKIGASSNSKRGRSQLVDKRYYIDDSEFVDIISFIHEMNNIAKNGTVKVISIDGISPNLYNV